MPLVLRAALFRVDHPRLIVSEYLVARPDARNYGPLLDSSLECTGRLGLNLLESFKDERGVLHTLAHVRHLHAEALIISEGVVLGLDHQVFDQVVKRA